MKRENSRKTKKNAITYITMNTIKAININIAYIIIIFKKIETPSNQHNISIAEYERIKINQIQTSIANAIKQTPSLISEREQGRTPSFTSEEEYHSLLNKEEQ